MRFLLYDKIVEIDIGKRALAQKMVSLTEEYLPNHYSKKPIMPTTLVIESIAQVAGWLNVISNHFAVETVLVLVEGVKCYQIIEPGSALDIEVWITFCHKDGSSLRGEIRIGNKIVATVERLVFANGKITNEETIENSRSRFDYLSGGLKLETVTS